MQSPEKLIVIFLPTNSQAKNKTTSPRLSFRNVPTIKISIRQKYFVVWKKNADVKSLIKNKLLTWII